MILVVSHENDDHTPMVLRALARRGAEPFVLDLSRIPRFGTVSLSYGRPGRRVIQVDGRTIDAADVTAVWWRRPQPMPRTDRGRRFRFPGTGRPRRDMMGSGWRPPSTSIAGSATG